MRKIITEKNFYEVTHYFESANGVKLYLPWDYSIKINLSDMTYTSITDEDYKECPYPTLNVLINNGDISEMKFPYTKIDCYLNDNESHSDIENIINFVQRYFQQFGYNVSREAIIHNYNAWKQDCKSGYLDKENGYHLFSPCGCNPLRFTLTSLHPTAADWQITYCC